MKIHGKMGFADFQEDDIQLPGFYTNIPPSRGWGLYIRTMNIKKNKEGVRKDTSYIDN